MNTLSKILFWIFTIALGFVNPLITIALIVLYYLPGIIQSACEECNGSQTHDVPKDDIASQNMNDYSDDVLEEMK
jgi:hypothetical protein